MIQKFNNGYGAILCNNCRVILKEGLKELTKLSKTDPQIHEEILKRSYFCLKCHYPQWICQDCGEKHSVKGQFDISSWHTNMCDVCLEIKSVTEPRDFYYPEFE